MNERQIRKVIESVLLGLAGGAMLGGCSGAGHRPDPNLPAGPDQAQVADAGPARDVRAAPPVDDERKHWRYRRRNRGPEGQPMPYMAPDAAPLHQTLT